jgi:hypothetical protein
MHVDQRNVILPEILGVIDAVVGGDIGWVSAKITIAFDHFGWDNHVLFLLCLP